jgi:hypothetical protein
MKRIVFVVSWFYKTFTPTAILVTIFHICTCDDVTLVNEKSIVSWKYMKSNKKCVFNVNFLKRSISISVYYGWKRSIKNGRWREIDLKIIFLLQISYSPHSGTNTKIKWDMCLCILNIIFYWPFSSVINRNRNRPFNLIQNKVGYRSCFATGVKLEQFSWNSFDVKSILEVILPTMSNELISKIIWRTNFLFGCLFCFLYFLVKCGDNIKVYFSIVTHEIPLRVRKKTT